jgi:hypothetical protein
MNRVTGANFLSFVGTKPLQQQQQQQQQQRIALRIARTFHILHMHSRPTTILFRV